MKTGEINQLIGKKKMIEEGEIKKEENLDPWWCHLWVLIALNLIHSSHWPKVLPHMDAEKATPCRTSMDYHHCL